MSRLLEDWVEGYLAFTSNTESPTVYHKWVSLSLIAAVLRKKVHLSLGRLKIYPNMYTVLVGPPAARKTQAIDFGTPFLGTVPDIFTTADSVTREALLGDLEGCAVDEILRDGTSFKHASISIIAREFESFLGNKSENNKMLVLLTDLFDCKELPWKYRTKNSGTNVIPSVYVNLLGATTPDSISSALPPSSIGSGLTSRVLFVWAKRPQKRVTRPVLTEELKHLAEQLQKDLFRISKIAGAYDFSPEAFSFWDTWYQKYDEMSSTRLCSDRSFDAWYGRKPMYIQKVAMIRAAARSDNLVIELEDIIAAKRDIELIEPDMARAFGSVGRSLIANDVDTVIEIIKEYKLISETQLMAIVWRDIDSNKLDNVIETAKKTGFISREFKHPESGKAGVFYKYHEPN